MSPISSKTLSLTTFDELAGWQDEDHRAALFCFQYSAETMAHKIYPTKSLGINGIELLSLQTKLGDPSDFSPTKARQFFEGNFRPFRFKVDVEQGLLTGYFEPELEASKIRTDKFCYPIYRRPDDLIDINANNRPDGMPENFVYAKQSGSNITEYFDRGEIQNGALNNQGLELYWLESPIDVFFAHIQGSACLKLLDGSIEKISFAAKSGHPYTPIGKILVQMGVMELKDVSMGSIRNWLKENPQQVDSVLSQNRSYIFFKTNPSTDLLSGPIGAANIPLSAYRSLAVDQKLHTYGTPIWLSAVKDAGNSSHILPRLCIAQDTGSAIVGPQRGDLFIGSGENAGEIAGRLRQPLEMVVFVPCSQLH